MRWFRERARLGWGDTLGGWQPRTERAIVVGVPREALALASKALTVAGAPAGAGASLAALDGGVGLRRQSQRRFRPQRRSAAQEEQCQRPALGHGTFSLPV